MHLEHPRQTPGSMVIRGVRPNLSWAILAWLSVGGLPGPSFIYFLEFLVDLLMFRWSSQLLLVWMHNSPHFSLIFLPTSRFIICIQIYTNTCGICEIKHLLLCWMFYCLDFMQMLAVWEWHLTTANNNLNILWVRPVLYPDHGALFCPWLKLKLLFLPVDVETDTCWRSLNHNIWPSIPTYNEIKHGIQLSGRYYY